MTTDAVVELEAEVLHLQLLVFLVFPPLILSEFTASYFAKNASEMDQDIKRKATIFRPISRGPFLRFRSAA